MSKSSAIVDFFSSIALRKEKENDLSDVTWAMLRASDTFLNAFLEFFFPKVDFSGEINIEREVSEDDSRPDFYFEYRGKTYLIENKIYDQNHHFEKYSSTFDIKPDKLGYITNYPMEQNPYVVHTWKEFYFYIQKYRFPKAEQELVNGYLEYVKSVCSIEIFKKSMNLEGMYSLYEFYNVLDEVFAIDSKEYSAKVYNSYRDTHQGGNKYCTPRQGAMGKYFDVQFKNHKIQETYGWFGVYFNEEVPRIYIAFSDEEGWGKPVYDLLEKNANGLRGGHKYFLKPEKDEQAYWFEFKDKKTFNKRTLKGQTMLLRNYFNEVLQYVLILKK